MTLRSSIDVRILSTAAVLLAMVADGCSSATPSGAAPSGRNNADAAAGDAPGSADADGPSNGGDGGTVVDASAADGGALPSEEAGGAVNDGAGGPTDAFSTDSGGPDEGGGDGSVAPNPPPGSTLCGEGPITEASARQECEAPRCAGPSFMTRCDALNIGGGGWQVWCSPTSTYFFAHFDEVTATGTFTDCNGNVGELRVGGGLESHGSECSNNGPLVYTVPIGWITPTTPLTVVAEYTYQEVISGTVEFLVSGAFNGCPWVPTVLTGVSMTAP